MVDRRFLALRYASLFAAVAWVALWVLALAQTYGQVTQNANVRMRIYFCFAYGSALLGPVFYFALYRSATVIPFSAGLRRLAVIAATALAIASAAEAVQQLAVLQQPRAFITVLGWIAMLLPIPNILVLICLALTRGSTETSPVQPSRFLVWASGIASVAGGIWLAFIFVAWAGAIALHRSELNMRIVAEAAGRIIVQLAGYVAPLIVWLALRRQQSRQRPGSYPS